MDIKSLAKTGYKRFDYHTNYGTCANLKLISLLSNILLGKHIQKYKRTVRHPCTLETNKQKTCDKTMGSTSASPEHITVTSHSAISAYILKVIKDVKDYFFMTIF